MKKLSVCLFLIAGAFIFTGTAFSMEYTVGVEDLQYKPYYSIEGKQYQGYAREILDAFAKEKGYTFKYKHFSVKRLFKNFIDGEIDFKFPDNPNWQIDLKKGVDVSYSEPAVQYIDGVMVLPDRKGKGVNGLKKLGTVMGFTAWDYIGSVEKGELKIYENSSFSGLLKQVIKGRLDGAYINPSVAAYQLNEVLKQPNALVFDSDLPHTKSAYMLSTLKHPEIIKEFNMFLQKNKQLVDSLKEQYRVKINE